mgnify:CR=1 FL=1
MRALEGADMELRVEMELRADMGVAAKEANCSSGAGLADTD